MKLAVIASITFLMFCLVSEGQAQSVGRDTRSDPSALSSRDVSVVKELNMTESQVKEARRVRATYSNRILKLRSDFIGKQIVHLKRLTEAYPLLVAGHADED